MAGLTAAAYALVDPSRPSPGARPQMLALHREQLVAMLHRLDALLFQKLVVGAPAGGSPRRPQSASAQPRRPALQQPAVPPSAGGVPRLLRLGNATQGRRQFAAEAAGGDGALLGGGPAQVDLDPGLLPFPRCAPLGRPNCLLAACAVLVAWPSESVGCICVAAAAAGAVAAHIGASGHVPPTLPHAQSMCTCRRLSPALWPPHHAPQRTADLRHWGEWLACSGCSLPCVVSEGFDFYVGAGTTWSHGLD